MINLFMSRRPDTAPLQMGVIPMAAAAASTTSGKLVLNANVNNLLEFNVSTRNIVPADAAGANERLARIFEAQATYNELADKLNGYIQWLNEKFSFSNLKPVSRLEAPSAASTAENPITEGRFKKFVFSLDHPSLTLKKMDFNAKGKLDVQVDVDQELQDEVINAALSYVYEDDYVRKTGEIPIVIYQGPLVGEWIRQWDDVRLVEDRSRGQITSEMDDEEGYEYFRKHRLVFTPTHAYYQTINPYVKSFDGEPYKLDGQDILTADGYKHTLTKDNWEIAYLADGRIRTRQYYTTYMWSDDSYYIRWLYECYHYRK